MKWSERSRDGFKAYDIRGLVPVEVDAALAYRVGRAYVEQYHPRDVAVGYDIRESSPALAQAVTEGLLDGGANVRNIGVCGTEMVYYATFRYGLDGGIMVTASHNPVDYNGLKLVREEGIPISADTGLKDIEARVFADRDFPTPTTRGQVTALEIQHDYIDSLLAYVKPDTIAPLKAVVNAGNGGAGIAFRSLQTRLPLQWTELYMDADATFPHGVPNPMLAENREVTIRAVKETGADIGIAWDGDFDRCFFIDEQGTFLEGYYVLGLLARYFLERHPGEKIIHDPRLYWNTQAICAAYGGIPVESKGGHAFMKETMRRVDGLYGAEMSAHHFFRDFSYCDSGMIPWLIVVQIMSDTGLPLSEMVAEMARAYPCSGEINRQVTSTAQVLAAVEDAYAGQAHEVKHLDGVSMDFGDWRFNLRGSNTEPLVRFNLETRGDAALMAAKRDEVLAVVAPFVTGA